MFPNLFVFFLTLISQKNKERVSRAIKKKPIISKVILNNAASATALRPHIHKKEVTYAGGERTSQ